MLEQAGVHNGSSNEFWKVIRLVRIKYAQVNLTLVHLAAVGLLSSFGYYFEALVWLKEGKTIGSTQKEQLVSK